MIDNHPYFRKNEAPLKPFIIELVHITGVCNGQSEMLPISSGFITVHVMFTVIIYQAMINGSDKTLQVRLYRELIRIAK